VSVIELSKASANAPWRSGGRTVDPTPYPVTSRGGLRTYTHVIGHATVVRLCGDLDSANAADLFFVLIGATATGPNLILDLRSVGAIDDAGLAELRDCRGRVARAAGRLCLAAPSASVRATLATAGPDLPLAIFDHADAALVWLAAPARR
jgi:anti-anti-sigma factor